MRRGRLSDAYLFCHQCAIWLPRTLNSLVAVNQGDGAAGFPSMPTPILEASKAGKGEVHAKVLPDLCE